MADYIIDNNSDLDNLYKNVEYVMKQICYWSPLSCFILSKSFSFDLLIELS
jgi:hypothetical protein